MKVQNLFLFVLAILLFNSCRSDEFSEELGSNPLPMDIPTSVTGDLTGLVVDENQSAIAGAQVELAGETTFTDENGVFNFENAVALSTGSLVNITKAGYYDGFKFTSFEPGQNSILKVQMVNSKIISSFQSSVDASIDVNGAQLFLPANITTRIDGSPYNGVVNVRAHWYDPTDENTIANMPGDLRGVDVEGAAVQLTTYGMMAVELSDQSGEELILQESMTATLTFPLPANSNGPDQIPMWHLDEASGVWIEEGMATKVGSAMVAEVSHFSFWNCDAPFDVVNLKGRLVTNPGENPISGLEVIITDNNQMITGYGYTNNDGVFSGQVPLGNDLTISTYRCGELIVFDNLGLFTEDTGLGNILIDVDRQLNLSASLLDCDGAAVESGFALISTDNSLDIVASQEGQINFTSFPCAAGVGTFQGYNDKSVEVSEELSFDLDEPLVALGEVTICDESIEEGITYSFRGSEPITLTNATVSIVDDTYLHIYAEDGEDGQSSRRIEIRTFLDGASLPHPWSQNKITINGLYNGVTHHGTPINDPITSSDNISGLQVGDSVSGVLENHPSEDFNMVYNFKIDQIITTPQVTGYIWVDTDGDGIREVGEDDSIPADLTYYVVPVSNQADPHGTRLYYTHTVINADGSYCIKGLARGIQYNVNITMMEVIW